jgi:hypothetical protein
VGARRVIREFYDNQLSLLTQALAVARVDAPVTTPATESQSAAPVAFTPSAGERPIASSQPQAFTASEAGQLVPSGPQAFTPGEAQPFTSSEFQPITPGDSHPFAPSESHPFTPSGVEGPPLSGEPASELPPPLNPVLPRPPPAPPRVLARKPRPPPPPPQPSAWDRLWKPIIAESLGWFIGAFLILAGTFAFVAGEWVSMSEVSRAATVFGVMVFWSLGFAGWARLLSRKEATRPASAVLWRISAAVAPLATVALGPIISSAVLLAWPLMLGQSVVAALLARKVALDTWAKTDASRGALEAGTLALASGFATFVLGAAPMLASSSAPWLELGPIALAMVAWRHGPADTGKLTRFSLGAMGYVLGLIAIRLHVAVLAAGFGEPWGIHAVALSAFGAAALELRQPTRRAADALRIIVVAVQGLVLLPAFVAPAPAFVLAALIATVTTARLAQRSGAVEAIAARWLVPAYAFGYVAFQRSYQLVPPIVLVWFQQLKNWLGYSTAPMPASYVSIYAALYVIGVGLFAGVALQRASSEGKKARASLLLTCTTWGSLFFAAVAMASLRTDVRPALVAVPLLFATTLGLGLWHRRLDLTRAAAALAVACGVILSAQWHQAWPVAVLALALALLSIVSEQKEREAFSAASMLLVALALGLSLIGPPALAQAVAIVVASAAALLVARNVDDPGLLSITCAAPLLLAVRFGSPLTLAVSGLLLVAALPGKGKASSRLGSLWLPSFVAALGAPLWHLSEHQTWPTFTLALGAATLIVGARRMRAADPSARALTIATEALGLLAVLGALVPYSKELAIYLPWHAQLAAAALALGCSVAAVRSGRSWQGVLLAAGAALLALGCAPDVEPWKQGLAIFSAVALLATPALLASITVPVAALAWMVVLGESPQWLVPLAVVLSLLALLEETDFTWSTLLNESLVAWAGTMSAAAALTLAILLKADPLPISVALLVLPLAWVRATRRGELLALGVALSGVIYLPGLTHPLLASLLLAPPGALFFARGVLGLTPVANALGVKAEPSRLLLLVSVLCAWLSVVVGLPVEVSALWAGALLLLGGDALAVNLVAAGLVAAAVPSLQLPGAGLLLVLAIALHHLPAATARVLGASRATYAVPAAALCAVAVAACACVITGGAAAQLVLGVALLVAAVLLGQWPLASLAVVLAGVDLHGSLRHEVLELTPWALGAALGAAALAIASRFEPVAERSKALWRLLGQEPQGQSSNAWWWGALGLLLASLVHGELPWLAVAGLLLLTPEPIEAAVALAVGSAAVLIIIPREQAAMALAGLGAALAWLGALNAGPALAPAGQRPVEGPRENPWIRRGPLADALPVARTWLHAGWVLALLALVIVGGDLHHAALPFVWGLGAFTAWAIALHAKPLEWAGWTATWLASHVLVAHLGLRYATGAPHELILPWLGLATALVALVALLLSGEDAAQRRWAGLALGWVGLAELFAAMSLLDTAHPREALVALAAGGLVLAGTIRRGVRFDDGKAAWLGQAVVVVTVLALRRLGAGVAPGVFEAWAAMTWGPVLWGLALFMGREERRDVAAALRGGAVIWPLVGLFAAPWDTPSQLVLLLLVQAGHYAWLAGSGMRRTGSGLSAIAFNGAMVAAFFATGWHGVQDLALPAGLSILALTWAFRDDLGRDAQVRLRAVAMTAVYAAAAWRPLTFTTTAGLIFCVLVCVTGVAAGAFLRIRSYVLLGTAFLVTSVVATLIRQGLAEPRLGAVLLAAVGLGIVAFMVVFTTRRAELQARMTSLQSMFSNWDR